MDSNNQRLISELARFNKFDQLRRSCVYQNNRATIERLLDCPKVYLSSDARPRLRSFLRVVQWNIERGSRLEGIVDAMNNHPLLRFADLLLLNEVDIGMARSRNRNVAEELSRALSAHAVFGAEYLEMTKGVGSELLIEADNAAALHGNAILTRHPFSNPRMIRLPRCENNFESAEKRLGGRIGILLDLEIAGASLTAAATHLDVVSTPQCRARQLRAFLEYIQSQPSHRVIFGGDLNTHTFKRGGRARTGMNVIRIFGSPPDALRRNLLHPETKEPALAELKRFGYEVEAFNDRRPTGWAIISRLEDARRVPFPMRWWVTRRMDDDGLMLEFKLDWLAGRGLRALHAGEIKDEAAGTESLSPQTVKGLSHNGSHLSDHDPVVVDIAFEETLSNSSQKTYP
ncbi:MAG: endonuclease/exonuclease/phosphatase family protein [Acidobacteriota bacterium]